MVIRHRKAVRHLPRLWGDSRVVAHWLSRLRSVSVDAPSVLTTLDPIEADAACAELRAHGIKCDTFAPTLPSIRAPYEGPDPGIQVIVAPADEERANTILDAWWETTHARPEE